MKVSTRDLRVISFVARFGQVLEDDVRRVLFASNASATPCNRTLRRLVEGKFLARIEVPGIRNPNGGRRPFVYQVGPAGWKLAKTEGTYWQARSVNQHSLAIASVYVSLFEKLDIITYETEPDSHVKINYVPLLPDLYVKLNLGDKVRQVWLEIDLGTERPKQLKEKLAKYHHAWDGAGENWNPWPLVCFVVPDERRKTELASLIAQTPKESQPMFRLALFDDVVQVVAQ